MADFRSLLRFPTAARFFKDFCVRTHCTENLFFWLDADNYAQLPGCVRREDPVLNEPLLCLTLPRAVLVL